MYTPIANLLITVPSTCLQVLYPHFLTPRRSAHAHHSALGSAHADDLRTTSCDVTSAEAQGNCVAAFCDAEHLKVNSSKTKALSFSNNPSTSLTINIAGQLVASQPNALCLGVWLRDDLSPSKSVQENIAKARRAFFCFRLHWSFRRQVEPTH